MSAQVDVLGYFDDLIRNGEEHHEAEARQARAAVSALIAERDALNERLNTNRCNRGHETLPLTLWDCPECHNETRRERDALREACQTFAEWLRREDEGLPAGIERGTPEGERQWRIWWDENLRICNLAQEQVRAALALPTGESA